MTSECPFRQKIGNRRLIPVRHWRIHLGGEEQHKPFNCKKTFRVFTVFKQLNQQVIIIWKKQGFFSSILELVSWTFRGKYLWIGKKMRRLILIFHWWYWKHSLKYRFFTICRPLLFLLYLQCIWSLNGIALFSLLGLFDWKKKKVLIKSIFELVD